MNSAKRILTNYCKKNVNAENYLIGLSAAATKQDVKAYQDNMTNLGYELARVIFVENGSSFEAFGNNVLVVSTAEDADYLSKGITTMLRENGVNCYLAVFWNNHYKPFDKSIAPSVHKFFQLGFECADVVIVVKSIISGSCVVRSNIIAILDEINPKKVYVAAPVAHINSEEMLRKEFPKKISDLFEFVTFALDFERDSHSGEVIPGIGGDVYKLLGLNDQPFKVGFFPDCVAKLVSST